MHFAIQDVLETLCGVTLLAVDKGDGCYGM